MPMPATPLPALLQGPRVRLRPFTAADITEAYIGWLNDPEVVRYSNQRFVRHTRESCERYLAGFAGSPNLFVSLRLMCADGSEQAVGSLTAYRSLPHGTADVGILLGERAVWGQGLGLEAWRLFTDWLLGTPGLRKLTAGTLACNRSMLDVAALCGMQREGVRRAQELVDGVATDIVYFARFAPVAPVAPTMRQAGDTLSTGHAGRGAQAGHTGQTKQPSNRLGAVGATQAASENEHAAA